MIEDVQVGWIESEGDEVPGSLQEDERARDQDAVAGERHTLEGVTSIQSSAPGSNCCRVKIIDGDTIAPMVAGIIGSVMERKRSNGPVPSISAASSRFFGMAARPTDSGSMLSRMPSQMSAVVSAKSEPAGSDIQKVLAGCRYGSASRSLTTPLSPASKRAPDAADHPPRRD